MQILDFLAITPSQAIKIALSVFLGLMIGFERELKHKPAGLRTHVLVCLGATLVTIVSMDYFSADSARIAAGIITGIGFLGAGAIIGSGSNVHGLTTAASLWTMATVGMGIGVGAYSLSIIVALIILLVLIFGKFEKDKVK